MYRILSIDVSSTVKDSCIYYIDTCVRVCVCVRTFMAWQKAMCPTTMLTSAQWLLASLSRLDLCLPVGELPTLMQSSSGGCGSLSNMGCCSPGYSSSANLASRLFVLPSLLESGSPSQDVWPDVPEWDEKQVGRGDNCSTISRGNNELLYISTLYVFKRLIYIYIYIYIYI